MKNKDKVAYIAFVTGKFRRLTNMKTKEAFAESSKDMLIARYVEETSTIDYGEKERIDLKELGKSMLASLERLKEFAGFSSTKS